jgi:hypothetical protein
MTVRQDESKIRARGKGKLPLPGIFSGWLAVDGTRLAK